MQGLELNGTAEKYCILILLLSKKMSGIGRLLIGQKNDMLRVCICSSSACEQFVNSALGKARRLMQFLPWEKQEH
jgi:hypothetical protein